MADRAADAARRRAPGTCRRRSSARRCGRPCCSRPSARASSSHRDSDVAIAAGGGGGGRAVHLLQPGLQPDGGAPRPRWATPRSGTSSTGPPTSRWSTPDPAGRGCGARALVVTLDTTLLGWRPQDLNLGSLPFARGAGHRAVHLRSARSGEIVRSASPPRPPGHAAAPGHARRGADPAVDGPATIPAAPATTCARRAEGGGRDVPRHLLQPGAELGPPRDAARAHDAADPPQGHPAPRRRPARASTPASTGSSCPTTAGGRSTGDRGARRAAGVVGPRSATGADRAVRQRHPLRRGRRSSRSRWARDACLLGRPHVYGLALAGADGVRQVSRTSSRSWT